MFSRIRQYPAFKKSIIPIILFLTAFLFRFINLNAINGKLWLNFLSDSSHYQLWAQRLFNGTDTTGVFPMGPLYPYIIYILYKLFGTVSQTPILTFQAIIGSAAVILIYFTARSAFGEKPAILTGILTLFYGPALLYDGLVLSESVQYFLYAVLIYFLIKCFLKKEWYYFIIAGIVAGLCALGRASVMIVLPFILVLYAYKNFTRKTILHISLVVCFFLLTIIPATIHNIRHGDKVLISSNFGINFYIGNNENADGRYLEPKGLSLSEDFTGKKIAEIIQGKVLKPSEVSSFWYSMALEYITEYPLRFIAMTCLKFLRFFEGYEIPQAEDYYYLKKFLPMLKLCIIPFWIIAPLGFTAFISTWKRKILSRLFLIFVISYSFSIIPFFILGRYRLLIAPALLAGSGYTIVSFFEDFKKKRFHVANIVIILLLFSFVMLPTLSEPRKADEASAYVNHGLYDIYNKNVPEAEIYFKKALSIKTHHVKALNNLAGVYFLKENVDDAIKTYQLSIAVDSTQGLPHLNLGIIYLGSGDIDAAKIEFEKAVSLVPFSVKAREYFNLLFNEEISTYEVACRLQAKGKYKEAIPFYGEALMQNPHDLRIYNNFGFALQAVGEYKRAIAVYEECIKLFPNEIIPLNNLASIYYKQGNLKKAKRLWIKCLEIEPNQPNVKKHLQLLMKKAIN